MKIIRKRIYSKCEEKSDHTLGIKFDFENNLSMREYVTTVLYVTRTKMLQPTKGCIYIDYQEAFDI